MKKFLLICSVALLGYAPTWAYSFEDNYIYYNIVDEVACEVEVTWDDSEWNGRSDPNYNSYGGSVDVPETVTYEGTTYTIVGLAEGTFCNSNTLRSVTLPETIRYIGAMAFENTPNLTGTMTISKNVEEIGTQAFANCNISNIEVDEANEYFSSEDGVLYDKEQTLLMAFPTFSEITTLEVPATVQSVDTYAFYYTSRLKEVIFPEGFTTVSRYAFHSSSVERVVFPETLTNLGEYSFYTCTSLSDVNLPESITDMGNSIFYGCYALEEVVFPNSITTIPRYACRNCKGLKRVTLGEKVTTVNDYAFEGCTALEEITFPETVTSLGNYVVGSTSDDVYINIYSLNTTPPTCSSDNTFAVRTRGSKVYVPEKAVDTYTKASVWSYFGNANVIEPLVAQTVTTGAATDITYKSATITCEVVEGSQSIYEYGVEYWGNDGVRMATTSSTPTVVITGLTPETSYNYKAYAKNPACGTVYGSEASFKTVEFVEPTVTTYDAQDVTYNSAMVRGFVEAGSDEIVEQGIEYWADKDTNDVEVAPSESTIIILTLEELTPQTNYTYRTYAKADTDIIYYGENKGFTTYDVPEGIGSVETNTSEAKSYYTVGGQRVSTPQKGVNILRMVDGTTKKIIVK